METETNIIKTDPVNLGSKGYYSLNVYKEDGSEVVEKRINNSGNVVTYGGAYRIFFGGKMLGSYFASVGTGTTELTRSSSGLGNRFPATSGRSSASRVGNEVDNGDGTSTLTLTRTMAFGLGTTVGTFSEVGVSGNSDGTDFFAGQLIKDELGNPTTITVLSDEQLRVTYTLELTVPNGELPVAPVIGSGTVSTPEGTSDYTIYAQPYFADYAIGSGDARNFRNDTAFAQNSSGTTGVDLPSEGGASTSHDGTGGVTVTSSLFTSPPAGFSMTDIRYLGVGGDGWSSTEEKINNTTKRHLSSTWASLLAVVEFSPYLTKDNTRTLSFKLQLTFTI